LNRMPQLSVTVELEQQAIACGNRTYTFSIDQVRRVRLLNGWDDIALTESFHDRIAAFKTSDRTRRPWAFPRPRP
jgi:3-isopropylmalate/(R)-2-methylmalate dehydratase small subunit